MGRDAKGGKTGGSPSPSAAAPPTSPETDAPPAAPESPPPVRRRFDSPQQEAFLELWRTYDRLAIVEDAWLGKYDLSPQQYNALRLMRAARPERMQTLRLAERLISRAPDISRLIDRLEARGLADRRRPADNRRIVTVGITDAGLALLADLDREVIDCHRRQLGHLPADQLATLIRLLRSARAPHEEPGSPWSAE
jgi:DNA-binding MarR family transcriptional regulator